MAKERLLWVFSAPITIVTVFSPFLVPVALDYRDFL